MGSRTVTSVDDIRFTMRLHEFYDQVGLSRVVSSLLSGNAGDETHRPFILIFSLFICYHFFFCLLTHLTHCLRFIISYHFPFSSIYDGGPWEDTN